MDDAGRIVAEHRRLPADDATLLGWLAALPGPVTVAMEATLYWAWRHDRLTDAGYTAGPSRGYIVTTDTAAEVALKTKLVRIGNSRGIRLPKPLIEEAGLEEDVQLEVRGHTVVIRAVNATRAGWAEAAAELAGTDEGLLDGVVPTTFDRTDCQW